MPKTVGMPSHHLPLTATSPNTSAMRARVPVVASAGSASGAKKPVAMISRLGSGAAAWRKSRTMKSAT